MKRCLLIRHGLPDFPDGQRRCLGVTDIPLGEEGLSQARDMAASLPPVSAVFSSPLTRAVQTAQAIHKNIIILEDLQELDYGQWDGLTFSEIRRQYPALYAARADDTTLPPPARSRMLRCFSDFLPLWQELPNKARGISRWLPTAA